MLSEDLQVAIGKYLGLTKKNEILRFLGIGMGGVLITLQALMSHRRARALEDTAKAQSDASRVQAGATHEQAKANENTERGQRQERLKNAIEHLGSAFDSVRMGGAYELFHLAEDTPRWRQTILDILCAHIRQTTSQAKYRDRHKSHPSEEVQTLLTLLFVREHDVFEDGTINLKGSWLCGAELWEARLQWCRCRERYWAGHNSRERTCTRQISAALDPRKMSQIHGGTDSEVDRPGERPVLGLVLRRTETEARRLLRRRLDRRGEAAAASQTCTTR